MESPQTETNSSGASPSRNMLPFIASLTDSTESQSLPISSITSATQTRSNSRSQLVRLPTLHPELEGYTPGEFSIRLSKNICEGLKSQKTKLSANSTESPNLTRQKSLQKSIKHFEDILRKREELSSSSARQKQNTSKAGGVVGSSVNLQLNLDDTEKNIVSRRILRRSNTMRNLVSSNLSINKTTPKSSSQRTKNDKNIPAVDEKGTLGKSLMLYKNKADGSSLVKKPPSAQMLALSSIERGGSGSRYRKVSLRQNSEIAFRVRHLNKRQLRRQSLLPLEELRRKTNLSCRFSEYGEAKFFFIKTVKMVTLLRKWWAEFSRKYQSMEYQMKTFLDLANDIEEVSFSTSQTCHSPGLTFDPKYYKACKEIGLSRDVNLILCMRPQQRTTKQIHQVVNGLQSLQAYAEYPLYMQEQLARVAYYQEITPKRVIVRQGHTPENFYFILSGTASVKVIVRDESNVSVNVVATLKTGQSFGEIALLHNSCRTATVESVTPMKLLSVWKDDFLEIFFNLKSDIEPEHVSFCRDIPFLKHWPIGEIMKDPGNCFSHYFKRGAVVVPDSLTNDWIYIVKTGSCRILKRLKGLEPYKTWDSKRPVHSVSLQNFGTDEKDSKTNSGFSRTRALAVTSPIEKAMTEFFLTKELADTGAGQETHSPPTPNQTEVVEQPSEKEDVKIPVRMPAALTGHSKSAIKSFLSQCKKVDRDPLPLITKPKDDKTYVKPAKPARPCYITLKKLLPKDAFGLESVEFEDEQYDRPSVSLILVSDGSEIVIISKKVFVKFANEFVRQYVREHVQYYPSDDILQENLQTELNWELYKDEVLQDTMEKLRVSVY